MMTMIKDRLLIVIIIIIIIIITIIITIRTIIFNAVSKVLI